MKGKERTLLFRFSAFTADTLWGYYYYIAGLDNNFYLFISLL